MSYISLHNQTHYSLLNSIISPKELLQKAKELNQSAIVISDLGTLSSSWEALKASKELGVKLIIGCEFYFVNDVLNKDTKVKTIVLLAKNESGYKNLLSLNRHGFDHSSLMYKRVIPLVDWKLLEKYKTDLVCLTSGGNGILSSSINLKKNDTAEADLLKLIDIYKDNLYIEVQANNSIRGATYYFDPVNQIFTNAQLIKLGKKHNVKIVPSSNTLYVAKEDAAAHDVFMAIGAMQPIYSGARIRYNVSDLYLKNEQDIKDFFKRNYDEEFVNTICENTKHIADMCEQADWIDPKHSNPSGKELPEFPVKDASDYGDFKVWIETQPESIKKIEEDKQYLRYKCEIVFNTKVPVGKEKEYRARLEEELDVFYSCGVSSYMLIVADYVDWFYKDRTVRSLGRGSVGGSFVAYLLNIHAADPIKYDLVFPRFFSKLRKSYADVDQDFPKEKRHLVIEYIVNKYGDENVASISNIIGLKPKVYVKDVARACELGGSREKAVEVGVQLSDCIDKDVKSFDDILAKAPLIGEYAKKYPEIIKYKKLCNKPRSFGTHAAGIVIGKRSLASIVPTRKDKDGSVLVEYDKDTVEEAGLIKMDILGIETLDVIEEVNNLIKLSGKEIPQIEYEAYDEKTYDLISEGDTFGVFQFGTSGGTIDLCKKIKPKCIEDLSIITTIARPASKHLRDDYILVRNGKKKIKLLHPLLKRAFEQTHGFPFYDESLLILAKDVAGWDLDEADKLRKLTKEKGKNPQKALQWRTDFINGAEKNKVDRDLAIKIWDDIVVPFGSYSFNHSHAVLYSYLSYHTAYLKAHYPIEFLLANLMFELKSNTPDAAKKIDRFKQEIRSHSVKILSPDVNKSKMHYTMISDNTLLTGLDAMKFLGDDAVKDIIEKRPFNSFDDFMTRVDSKKVRSTSIQALVASGCLDSFGISRKLMYLYCSDYRKKLQIWKKKHDINNEQFEYPWPITTEWSKPELYALEKEYIGEAFVCSTKEAFESFFKEPAMEIKDIRNMADRSQVVVRSEIKDIFEFKIKKETSRYFGKYMAKALIEDCNGDQISLTIFPDQLGKAKEYIKDMSRKKYGFEPGIAINFSGSVNIYEGECGIILDNIFKFASPPQPPKDLKAKQVAIKKLKSNKDSEITKDIASEIEDELFNEGLIDLNEENDEDDY